MTIKVIGLDRAKAAARVKNDFNDTEFDDLIESISSEMESHIEKQLFESQEELDSALLADPESLDVERCLVLNADLKNAACLLIQYYYDGVSALGAEKIEKAAYNILNKYKLATA